MDFVYLEAAGSTYKLRYTADDIQDICRRLNTFQPVGAGKVMPTGQGGLGNMLLALDPDAIQYCLWAGMRHIAEYKNADPTDAMRIIRAHIERGGQWTDFRRPILKTFIACGFAEFAPIIKILEDAEAQLARDGAIDITPNDVGADAGNVSRPPSPSLTRSSMPPLLRDDSDSSTLRDG